MNQIRLYNNYIFCFFSRKSENKFSSLNCAFNRGDSDSVVKKNRIFCSNYLNKKQIILTNQFHSNVVSYIDKDISKDIYSDAMITNRKDILLGILTADCAPIIVLGKKYFGIIHAGWKGLINGIIENTIMKFYSLGETENDLNVFVGPHLCLDSFEVKKDFVEIIKKKIKNYDNFIINNKQKKNLIFPV